MIEVKEYLDESGHSPFGRWFDSIDGRAAAKVAAFRARLQHGNFSIVEGVGKGVFEGKIDYGPGYRVYFGKDGKELVILLAGGDKKSQKRDIKAAQGLWKDYKARKRKKE
jgi:putative addiction module killer protein